METVTHHGIIVRLGCVLALAGCATHNGGSTMKESRAPLFTPGPQAAVVRYQVKDVERAVAFYTGQLGFEVKHRAGAVIATVARGDLNLILSGPESSGSRSMPDGRRQEPGGWNRIVVYVDGIDETVAKLRSAGTTLRNDVETGPGGKQVQVEDPDGNPIELHEAPRT